MCQGSIRRDERSGKADAHAGHPAAHDGQAGPDAQEAVQRVGAQRRQLSAAQGAAPAERRATALSPEPLTAASCSGDCTAAPARPPTSPCEESLGHGGSKWPGHHGGPTVSL